MSQKPDKRSKIRHLTRSCLKNGNAWVYSNGFILVAVLIFLQVFSFMSIYALFRVAETIKHNTLFFHEHNKQIQSEKLLLALEHRASMDVDTTCQIPITAPAELAHNSKEWWQGNACNVSTNGWEQYYVVEWLEDDVCGQMGLSEQGPSRMARYYRMTLYTAANTLMDAKLILQSTIALPVEVNGECQDNRYHGVDAGRQMWREI